MAFDYELKSLAVIHIGFPSTVILKNIAGIKKDDYFLVTTWKEFDSESDYRSFVNFQGDIDNN